MSVFTGSGVAIVTPFIDRTINYPVFGELIDFQISNGTDAIIVCGTTGEASTMSVEEHISAVRYAVERVNKRVPVIAGTGSNNTEKAIMLTQMCEQAGADAALVVTPYYNKCTQKGLAEYYRTIAGSTNLPIILYNVPARTNVNINPKTYRELSDVSNIVAIKEANSSLDQLLDIFRLCGNRFDVYSGNDEHVFPLLALGGKGVISVAANILPREMHDMVRLYMKGQIQESLELQLRLFSLIKALFIEVNPIPVKAALKMIGSNAGSCRSPLSELEDENYAILKAEIQKLGLCG